MTDHTTPDAPWFEFDFESCRDAHPLDAGQTCELQQGHERHRRGRDTWSVDVDTVDRIENERDALQARIDDTLEAINRYAAAFGDAKMLQHLRATLTGEEPNRD